MPESTYSIQKRILSFLQGDRYRPLKQHELARALDVKGSERTLFRHVLFEMERRGEVVRLRKNRWALPDRGRQVTGRLKVHVQGFGFVAPEPPGGEDVFVPEKDMGTALDGDLVIVALEGCLLPRRRPGSPFPNAVGPAGRVLRVVERRHADLVGLLRRTTYYWYVIPDNPRILRNVRVRDFADSGGSPKEYSKVVVRLDEWASAYQPLSGVLVEDLGPADAPGIDVLSVLRSYRLEVEFPADAAREAERHTPTPPHDEIARRRDHRDLMVVTIDPEDAKDFDDAVSLCRTPEGEWQLGVHIADVPHYVAAGSAVDREAGLRGNSVYLVDRVIPMLPPYLTTKVCSLQPGQDRLTHTVSMRINDEGKVLHSETYLSVIRSGARLNYDQVQAFFDDRADHGMVPTVLQLLSDMRQLARVLRRRRMAAGSIDLILPEIRCVLDAQGRPLEIRKRASNEAYQLIEEFMLAANCVVARLLDSRDIPAIYRIHEPPDDKQWAKMDMDLQALGVTDAPDSRKALNAVARQAKVLPTQYALHLAILRNLKRAVYSSIRQEHFGLAFSCYTHFTSPIRRYPDLIVHRILRAAEERRPAPYSAEDVSRIAQHCSGTEQNADEAEDESVSVKRIEFYRDRLERGETGPYHGLIVSVVPKGLILELSETLQRGLLPLSALRDDTYVVMPQRSGVVGRRHRRKLAVGQTLDVMLAKVDAARRLVDFYLAEEGPARRGKRRRRKS
ncbi:MAG: VacB/RNase II family 3'-5' exoribonuclease [Verrucomicrobiota bacterium]